MTKKRLVGMWAGPDWHLRSYAWRGPCVKSPMTGENMRAIVAVDGRGKYHPGMRNSGWGADREYKTVYQDFSSYDNKDKAIEEAKAMLSETLHDHRQTHDYVNGKDAIGGSAPENPSRTESLLDRATTPHANKPSTPNRQRSRSIDR